MGWSGHAKRTTRYANGCASAYVIWRRRCVGYRRHTRCCSRTAEPLFASARHAARAARILAVSGLQEA